MGKMIFQTVVADAPTGKNLGSRREDNLKGIFRSSPLYTPAEPSVDGEGKIKLTPEGVKEWFLEHVVNGVVPQSEKYYGFAGSYSRDFTGEGASIPGGPPNYSDVKTGAGGLPSTAFVPNPSSPGEGNGIDAEAKPAADAFASQISLRKPSTPGSGAAANEDARNPSSTSKAMKTATLGQLMGKSPASAAKS